MSIEDKAKPPICLSTPRAPAAATRHRFLDAPLWFPPFRAVSGR